MLFDEVTFSLSHLAFIGLVFTNIDQHLVHKTDVISLALWRSDAFILYPSEQHEHAGCTTTQERQQLALPACDTHSQISQECELPPARDATINIFLSKLRQQKTQGIPKPCVVELRSRACWP